jgi:flagellar hook-length control protein FliK
MSDRLAATILHSTQMNVPVTLDKIPQAVVTVALTARSATLQIDPPELGRIQLDYQFDVQGRTVVTLTPETDAARAALAERMSSITASLQAQAGGEIDVKLGSSQDFGAERGDAANSDMGEGGQQSADTSGGVTEGHQSTNDRALVELQRFAQAAANGDSTRLHILV